MQCGLGEGSGFVAMPVVKDMWTFFRTFSVRCTWNSKTAWKLCCFGISIYCKVNKGDHLILLKSIVINIFQFSNQGVLNSLGIGIYWFYVDIIYWLLSCLLYYQILILNSSGMEQSMHPSVNIHLIHVEKNEKEISTCACAF